MKCFLTLSKDVNPLDMGGNVLTEVSVRPGPVAVQSKETHRGLQYL